MDKSLDNKATLFTLLAAIIKKSGDSMTITEDDLISVTKSDKMILYYDKKNKEILLKLAPVVTSTKNLN